MPSPIEKFLSYRIIRFLISGGLSAVIHIGMVFVLTHVFSVWYLYSTTIGFLCAVIFNFILQKFFTFRDSETNALPRQLLLFFLVATINLVTNGLLMVLFVSLVHLIPVIAQIATSALIAMWSYYIYGKLFRLYTKPFVVHSELQK